MDPASLKEMQQNDLLLKTLREGNQHHTTVAVLSAFS